MFNYVVREQRPSEPRQPGMQKPFYRANYGSELYNGEYFVCFDGLLESLPSEQAARHNAELAVEWYTDHHCRCERTVFRFTGFALVHVATFNNFDKFPGAN